MSKTMQYFWDEAEKNVDEIAMKVVKGLIDIDTAVKEVGNVANLELLNIYDEMDAKEYLTYAIEDLQ